MNVHSALGVMRIFGRMSVLQCSKYNLLSQEGDYFFSENIYLTSLLWSVVCINCSGSIFESFFFNLSFSTAFFISCSSCFVFSSWALWNILTKLSNVEMTTEADRCVTELAMVNEMLYRKYYELTLPCSKGQRAGSSPKYRISASTFLPYNTLSTK